MGLFQKSIEKKYLNELDPALIDRKFQDFCLFFGNSKIQENIRFAKEEQFQGGFFRELFGKILGYTLNPEPNFNLTTELKNISNNRKTDGAILKAGDAIAVIELKSTTTTDFDTIEKQAFGYKNHHPQCRYVITSNFARLRFYIQNAVEFLEFDLFNLSKAQFALLWICISKESLLNDLPIRMKEISLLKEENVTRNLYADYAAFRRELFESIKQLNPEIDKLLLFRKTQKLLDRFLFILFAEDRLLLPPNSINEILIQWKDLREKYDTYFPLYDRFKKYFGYMNSGHKGIHHEIFAYNGGLFAQDELLDNMILDDELIYRYTMLLSKYDFETEVDVNILGHIFEHSLSEIEHVQSLIKGEVPDRQMSKRKKDGIFYTPKYVTRYIVDNTIGELCRNKRQELEIIDEDYFPQQRKDVKKKLLDKIETYRNWLKQLKILDPACGSGAFLNQALDFLIAEHRKVDELKTSLLGGTIILSDIENEILENNIFGVDLNEESVEIAKLSLWLRTAKKGRKLNTLSRNIKCGNSLIDDPELANDKAFNWFVEFPQVFPYYKLQKSKEFTEPEPGDREFLDEVQEPSFSYKPDSKGFEKHGFDAVIGNPPYIPSTSLDDNTKKYLYAHYQTAEYQINTYGIFIEKSLVVLKNKAMFGLIVPNYWLSTKFDSNLRRLVFKKNHAISILNTCEIFEDATVDTLILIGRKTTVPEFPKLTEIKSISSSISNVNDRLTALSQGSWEHQETYKIESLGQEISISFQKSFLLKGDHILGDYFACFQGMKPYEKGKGRPLQTREMMNGKIYHSSLKTDDTFLPLIGSADLKRYYVNGPTGFIKYGANLAAPRKYEIFTGPRLLVNRIFSGDRIDVAYTESTMINNTDVFNLIPKPGQQDKLFALLAILASEPCAKFFRTTNVNLDRKAFPKLNVYNLENFPIPNHFTEEVQVLLSEKAKTMITETSVLVTFQLEFVDFIQSKFGISTLSHKLQKWFQLDFKDFIHELQRLKVKLSLIEEAEWMKYFNSEKKKVLDETETIRRIDREIDEMIYGLYDLMH